MGTKEELLFFEKFYRDTKCSVEHYLMGMIHNCNMIDDVVQEVYLEAYRKLDVLMQHPEPKGFLFRMARYKALHYLREQKRMNLEEILCEDSELEMKPAKCNEMETAELLLTLKNKLTEGEYSLFVAHYIQGYTEKEIAATRQKSYASVRMSCSRMTRKLRRLILENDGWAS